jgi:hypothetical protein
MLSVSLSEPDVENGLSECMDMSDETSISGVSMEIGDARSETSDIESEVDVPDNETSDSAEVMNCWKCHCWIVRWCSISSWSITVRIIGVGILLTSGHVNITVLRRCLNMPSTCLSAEHDVKCILLSFLICVIFHFIFQIIQIIFLPNTRK